MASPNISEGKEASVEYFNNWVEEVKKTVPKERLLVFSVKEGWGPLCKFLNVPIPDGPFPNTNDTAQMKKYVKINQIVAYSFVFGIPILLGSCAYFFVQTGKMSAITYRCERMLCTLSFLEDQIQKKFFSTTDACFHVKLMRGIQNY